MKKNPYSEERFPVKALPELPTKNQLCLGSCAVNTMASQVERLIHANTGKVENLSASYLWLREIEDRALSALVEPFVATIKDSGSDDQAMGKSVAKHGMIPASASPELEALASNPRKVEAILRDINDRIRAYHEEINRILEVPEPSLESGRRALENARRDIRSIADSAIGSAAQGFMYQGKRYNARDFMARAYGIESFQTEVVRLTSEYQDESRKAPVVSNGRSKARILPGLSEVSRERPRMTKAQFLEKLNPNQTQGSSSHPNSSPAAALEPRIRETIDQGKSVALGIAVDLNAVAFLRGIFGIKTSKVPTPESLHGHALLIVGYGVDETTGQIAYYKVQNSWGKTLFGKNGYGILTPEYFRRYAQSLVFDVTPNIKSAPPVEVSLPKTLRLVAPSDPALSHGTHEVSLDVIRHPTTQRFFDSLVRTMKESSGAGIAAPQVGHFIRVAVISKNGEPFVIANPVLKVLDATPSTHFEGCLSMPWDMGFVTRPKKVRVNGLDRFGNRVTLDLDSFEAAVAQHEIDHLDGVLFPMRWTRYPRRFGIRGTGGLAEQTRLDLGRLLHSLSPEEKVAWMRRAKKINRDLYDLTDNKSLTYSIGNESQYSTMDEAYMDLLGYHRILCSTSTVPSKAKQILAWTKGSARRAAFVKADMSTSPEPFNDMLLSLLREAAEFKALAR